MITETPAWIDFTMEQHAVIAGCGDLLRSAALRAKVTTDTGADMLELYRPRDPSLSLWLITRPGADELLEVWDAWGGQAMEVETIEDALASIVAIEQGEPPPPIE